VTDWQPVIGLEIHVQLKTRTKMFCRCANGFGGGPNTQTCPVCLAFPGALPVPNKAAIEQTIKLGLALGCEIATHSVFHRKNYFYPDLPKAYQISQYDEPLCVGGRLDVPTPEGEIEVGIVRAHLEEDAAKNVHVAASGRIHGATATLVDFNRGGTPLLEIVTEPELHSSDDAKRFLQLLRQTVVELGLSDAELDKGSMRFDVNVSVRPVGSDELRTRCELKNMNSFNFAAKGIEREIARQIKIYEAGGTVDQETLHFDPNNEDSPPLRSKEEAQDYRYFPEPDLVPIEPPAEMVETLRATIGELPAARIRRIAETLSFYDADVLVTGGLDLLWSAVVAAGADAKETANVLANPFVAAGVEPGGVNPAELAKLVSARAEIPRAAFDEALARSGDDGFSADPYLAQKAVSDVAELDPVIDGVIAANPGQAGQYRGGKEGLLGFFVGQVMKETGGKADPRVVSERVRAKLSS
jgi:aspartyl-tRNA(Asn)/glutamyl-tRNA(Gln) amidotransferase subunit B